ncbi:MAG TPA: DUF222 domain-containing protein [Streptosporangiaceae bacterium]|nr:DUF222 domain-containing protein [Streptosporangiaceae bacterium]
MCGSQPVTSSGDALLALDAGLSWLATADMVALTTDEQSDCLRALERAESRLTAARAVVLSAFDTASGYEVDAARGSRSWLRWQTRVTGSAATTAVGWMRRLRAHPAVVRVLAQGGISASWARQLCDWSDTLPEDKRADADQIMLAAADDGCELSDIGRLAEEMYRRCAPPDTDGGDEDFTSRNLRLTTHFRGHAKLDGDLTPECNAALQAVLDALGKRVGPEDLRSPGQRRHDALQEACRRLIAAGGLPDRAGQPTQIQLHMTLQQLLGLDGAAEAVAGWPAAGPGWDCDAAISPIVTGTLDADLLDQLASDLLDHIGTGAQAGTADDQAGTGEDGAAACEDGTAHDETRAGEREPSESEPSSSEPGSSRPSDCGSSGREPNDTGPSAPAPGEPAARDSDTCPVVSCRERGRTAARQLVISRATRLLSGPSGLAAYLRTQLLPQPAASMSLPLDVGRPTEVVPPHLRRAIIARDRHCAFPGCDEPPAGCQVHHLVPRSQGGTTSLENCYLQCSFHHLVAVHTWGWQLHANPDGTLTASSPYRIYTSHSPPVNAA